MHSNIYVRTLGYQKKNEVGNLMENDLNLVANSACALAWIILSRQSLNMKFAQEETRKNCIDLNKVYNSLCL